MTFGDFCRLEPDEFAAVVKRWSELSEARERGAWERARAVATVAVSPHIKGRPTPQRIMPMPWDHKKAPARREPDMSPEQRLKRFERMSYKIDRYEQQIGH